MLFSIGHFAGKGRFLKCENAHLLVLQKTSDYLKFMMCPHGHGGRDLIQCEHFLDKGGVNFSQFCAEVLWMAPLLSLVERINGDFDYDNVGNLNLLHEPYYKTPYRKDSTIWDECWWIWRRIQNMRSLLMHSC